MKIYFDGCSWTEGSELKNPEEERYSKIICNKLGAEEYNLGKGGGSNDRIIRNLMVENDIEEYDMAIIQMTFPARTEYLRVVGWVNNWIRVNPKQNYSRWLYTNSEKEKRERNDQKWGQTVFPKSMMPTLGDNKFDYFTKADGHANFWRHYYTSVSNLKYFNVKENIQKQTISNHCKVKGVPLILCSINRWSKLHFDFIMSVSDKNKAERGHPNKEGHRLIAEAILDKI
tara:strand:- start:27 stop:713 length:687 start_codon:yes stop_codon:yes gene_type:complete